MDEERLPQQILNWTPPGTRKRGRPKTRWKEGVLRATKECGLREGDWEDRPRWRLCRRTLPYIIERLHTYKKTFFCCMMS
jgi:hypothetical protein